ncbi:dTDP-4-amino-4,6-dideoxygalactose transaminase [Luteibacter sp. 3190]|uniref:dTDP-4-amino-4,6-dideoxygalactose transaminase n=1 Tax=Luteibacter sp. 3190 TaxID=2817736 RepID=UPI00285958CE|nr:dTDP-4-amino-4,6-dideoxygalactose transaminase [Luteibacter sp. 3190]MDR6936851.1 dTDP-4-amino-4,6-dideoxygalactose transaminase [Luteibacter sp. 3190]
MEKIPFNKPYMTGKELDNIARAHSNGHLSGDGPFTHECHARLEALVGTKKALLTHSCTAALEMAAILLDLAPGDEVIMPSYTFVSTANAFVLRGAIPVFVDIREDTLNIDETLIENAITEKTKAICVVHYAGVSCEMDSIMDLAGRYGLYVIEDAAQGIFSAYKGRALGSIGHLAALSFHETKNIISGEGGALLVNDERLAERAEIIREKGTNRSRFFRGQVDKYTWVDVGSSFLPGEITAAFLLAQLDAGAAITAGRMGVWSNYDNWATSSSLAIRRPVIPDACTHNAHMYYLLTESLDARTHLISGLRESGIQAVFHYLPLHSSPAGRLYGRAHGDLPVTIKVSDTLVRLPLWLGIESAQQRITDAIERVMSQERAA